MMVLQVVAVATLLGLNDAIDLSDTPGRRKQCGLLFFSEFFVVEHVEPGSWVRLLVCADGKRVIPHRKTQEPAEAIVAQNRALCCEELLGQPPMTLIAGTLVVAVHELVRDHLAVVTNIFILKVFIFNYFIKYKIYNLTYFLRYLQGYIY